MNPLNDRRFPAFHSSGSLRAPWRCLLTAIPVASNIGANNPGFLYRLAKPMIKHLFPSADRAARTAMMLATAPDLAKKSGGYYRSEKHRERPLDFDAELSERLWRVSAELTGADL